MQACCRDRNSIVDQKLDRYMSEKADRGDVHLLIDRFRFDSFLIDSDGGLQSTLLTRFGIPCSCFS